MKVNVRPQRGSTWDALAYDAVGDEFLYETLIAYNPDLCDVVAFDGVEIVSYTVEDLETEAVTLPSPWD